MSRVKGGVKRTKTRRRLLKRVRGFVGTKKNLVKRAKTAALHAGADAYRDRRRKKREFRALWQIQINAATRGAGLSYSTFMGMLKKKQIGLNRLILSQLAAEEPRVFEKIVQSVK